MSASPSATEANFGPIIIGHRGASGHRPEHTLASYKLAIELGADFIEPDLVFTRDGMLVARHENEISGTTDVSARPEFHARKTTKTVDGVRVTGWFTEDFTLAELKTLRARERLPDLRPGNKAYDGRLEIPTFDEVLELARVASRVRQRPVGVYPETKHPSYFASLAMPFEEALLHALQRHGYETATAPVFIQSFEVSNLQKLKAMTELPLVQLIDASGAPYDFVAAGDPRNYADLITPRGLTEVARYARAIGVHKNLILPRDASGALTRPTALIGDAHAAGLRVHAWTFRSENHFLPTDLRKGDPGDVAFSSLHGDPSAEYHAFFGAGVDGVFSDFPGEAVEARHSFNAT